ncbi:hypothetical protein, partial [Streptomyces brasiliscabiei]|uniref:hypothetical protein n=1 Tax=Streptomyces brasiliscabiei TaxID=2736302 RepID=UPI001C0FE6B0
MHEIEQYLKDKAENLGYDTVEELKDALPNVYVVLNSEALDIEVTPHIGDLDTHEQNYSNRGYRVWWNEGTEYEEFMNEADAKARIIELIVDDG